MKKFLFGLFLLSSVAALAGQYADGTYRGLYISRQDTEVEVQFDLKDDVITKATFRALSYKGHDWLKEDEFVAKNGGYLKTLEEITGKKIQDVLPTLYNEKEIETAGATVRKGKIRAALQYGLNLGPYRLPKK
ncbi:hypothetical protein [Fusobacterium russii]|uniref:hypothetical protein n=1 Tax=Fusobacterium russii TaxID=854 RepID=UPI0003A3B6C1|nr:hypothetical protein [Fusobacterium russii]